MNDRKIFVLKEFIGIMSDCRRRLIADVLHDNHDLYNFLCADKENVRDLYKQRYELKWLELHFSKCEELLNGTNLELAARCEVMKIFLRRYLDFAEAWDYKPRDVAVFRDKIKSLDILIQTEEQWTKQLNSLKTSFLLETKRLDELIRGQLHD